MPATSSDGTAPRKRSEDRKPRDDRTRILELSNELLLLIVQQADRHDDIPNLRLTCKRLRNISEEYMFCNVALTLPEDCTQGWDLKLQPVPRQVVYTKHLSLLNRCQYYHGGHFYADTIPAPDTHRQMRWEILDVYSDHASDLIMRSGLLKGSLFDWAVKIPDHQLKSYRYRLAVPGSLELLAMVIAKHANSLMELELSMLQPPCAEELRKFNSTLDRPSLHHKLRKLTYRGLSYTEPLPVNGPNPEGRFRAVRLLFRKNFESIKQLRLSQEHCISQTGKSPLWNGRTYSSTLCNIDELYHSPVHEPGVPTPHIDLDLELLELGGFRVSALLRDQIRPLPGSVTVQVPSLRRLVLEDCGGVEDLLDNLSLRSEELQLLEFAIRVEEHDEHMNWGDYVATSLKHFLLSFKGLQTISILWKGDSLSEVTSFHEAIHNHDQSLTALVFDERWAEDENHSRFSHTNIPKCSALTSLSKDGINRCEGLTEIGITLTASDVVDRTFPVLHLLSRYRDLRTVHIRAFPPIQSWGDAEKPKFWRVDPGIVSASASSIVEKFAESISLPFFTLPKGCESESLHNSDLENQLQDVLEAHRNRGARNLHDPIGLNDISASSTLLKNPVELVLKGKVEHDQRLKHVLKAVKLGHANLEEQTEYDEAFMRVKWALESPTDLPKPTLQLLIIGDWRYRDQMNITGPRSWDPQVWCLEKETRGKEVHEDSSDEDVGDGASSADSELGTKYKLQPGFTEEWDPCLMPLFFKIDWEKKKHIDTNRYYWKSKATYLKQTSLEGYGALGHVKCLDFAWQD